MPQARSPQLKPLLLPVGLVPVAYLIRLERSEAVERFELSETVERDIFTVARCLVPVAYLIENRGASIRDHTFGAG